MRDRGDYDAEGAGRVPTEREIFTSEYPGANAEEAYLQCQGRTSRYSILKEGLPTSLEAGHNSWRGITWTRPECSGRVCAEEMDLPINIYDHANNKRGQGGEESIRNLRGDSLPSPPSLLSIKDSTFSKALTRSIERNFADASKVSCRVSVGQ